MRNPILPALIAGLLLASAVSASFANTLKPSVNTALLISQKNYVQFMNQCSAPKRLSGMMSQAIKQQDNYQAKAHNASMLEEIMLNNPTCFVQAANALPANICAQVEAAFINETFFYPRDQIKQSLTRAKDYAKSCIAT